jgi:hypothetical protein
LLQILIRAAAPPMNVCRQQRQREPLSGKLRRAHLDSLDNGSAADGLLFGVAILVQDNAIAVFPGVEINAFGPLPLHRRPGQILPR